MERQKDETQGRLLRAVVRRLLGSDSWCETWAHGCPLDSALAVLERAPLLPEELAELSAVEEPALHVHTLGGA